MLHKEFEDFKTQHPAAYTAARVLGSPIIPYSPVPMSVVAGKGTFFQAPTEAEKAEDANPETSFSRKLKAAGSSFLDSSLIVPNNAVDPAWAAAHPHEAAAARGVSNVVQQLTTPASLGLIVATSGMSELPAILEKGLATAGLDVATAAKAAKVSKAALQGLGVYFTADQIARVVESVPAVGQAILTGQTDKAIELATSAFVNGAVAGVAAHEVRQSIFGGVDSLTETGAMKNRDYADLVHERQKTLQVAGGQKAQVADLGREVIPSVKDREWATEYVEAAQDRDTLRARQAETKAGPTATEQINAAQRPATEAFPVKGVEHEAAPAATEAAATKTAAEKTQITPEDLASPAAQHALSLMAALKDAAESSKAHIITPEERAAMVEQQDPNRTISAKMQNAIDFVVDKMDVLKQEAQRRNLLPQGQVRENYVPHEYGFDDTTDPTRRRLYDTYHEAQQNGLVAKNKDYFALTSDYIANMWNRIADADTITKLKTGRTNEGMPLAVSGGFVEGSHVATEGAQSQLLSPQEVQRLTKSNQLPDLIRSGDVIPNPGGTYRLNSDKYVKATNLSETRPIGPIPIPKSIAEEMKANGTMDALVKKGLIYQDKDGNYINKDNLYARVPVYLYKDVADHFNNVVKPRNLAATSFFGRAGEFYDDITGNMKSLLLSWSPFHRVTESMRMMESLGIVKGGALALQTNLGMAEPIDYFNLSPTEESAIRDGIVTSDPRGRSMSNVEEGVSAGENTWGAKSYKLLDKGLEKLGVPAEIRNKINLQKILTDDVFGPNGMITHAKFALYEARKPQIAARIAADHPDWSPQEVDKQAGRLTASFANDKFGGLNQILLGRTLQDQKILRRVLLAPDFLESTGRSIIDLARPYGNDMAANLIRFNIAHLLSVAGINYALHHEEGDDTIKGAVEASHLLDHPFGVVSADGKTVYGVRTTVADFIHAVSKPFDFGKERLNPAVKSIDEILEQRNQYGRKESFGEALKSIPKATLPIQIQGPLGLGAGSVTEPTSVDQLLKSLGVQSKPNRTPAEDAAIGKVAAKLQGTEAQTGPALVKQRLKFNAEDKLRDAIQALQAAKKNPNGADFIKLQADYNNAARDVDTLARKRIITPEERKKVLEDAKTTRLASIFTRLSPSDSLDVWERMNDLEKRQIGPLMHKKYMDWSGEEAKKGVTSTTLSPEDQQILNRFRVASGQLTDIMNRPAPRPKPAPQTNNLDLSAGLRSIVASREGTPLPALAPAPYEETPLPAPVPAPYEETPLPAPVPMATRTEPMSDEELSPMIKAASEKYGVDEDLIRAVIKQESNGSPVALSPRGAQGIMQLMDATAKQYGVRNVFDPAENIDAGVHFLADLLKRYDGDVEKTLAAYNAGPERVDEAGGVPQIPETQAYVRAIMKRVKG